MRKILIILLFQANIGIAQIDSTILKHFNVSHYFPVPLKGSKSWEVTIIKKNNERLFLKLHNNILTDSSYRTRLLEINNYFIEKNKIYQIDEKVYRMKDSVKYSIEYTSKSKKELFIYSTFFKYTNLYKTRIFYYNIDVCKNCHYESIEFDKKGNFIVKIIDSNGIVRSKCKGNRFKANPNKTSYYNSHGKKEFVLVIVNDSVKSSIKFNDSIYVEEANFNGIDNNYLKSLIFKYDNASFNSYIIKKRKKIKLLLRKRWD